MLRILVLTLALMIGAAPASAACRLALALGLDISSSVNPVEYAIQRDGLVAALRDEEVKEALRTQDGEVYIAAYEWSGWQQQDLLAGWTKMTTDAAVDAFADKIAAHVRPYADFPTAIGKAAQYGANLLRQTPEPCERLVIDLSGDGVNNDGVDQKYFRDKGLLDGITINALVIKGAFPDPEQFYRARVISGVGAFLLVARNGFDDYPDLIKTKLLREIKPDILLGALRE